MIILAQYRLLQYIDDVLDGIFEEHFTVILVGAEDNLCLKLTHKLTHLHITKEFVNRIV